ncbi:unnamed protein product [Alternaria sp. RS040]
MKLDTERVRWRDAEQRLTAEKFEEKMARSESELTWKKEKLQLEKQFDSEKLQLEKQFNLEKLQLEKQFDSEKRAWGETEQRLKSEKFDEKVARSNDELAWRAEKLKLKEQFESEKQTWRETEQRLNSEKSDETTARIRDELTWNAAKLALELEEQLSTAAAESETRKQTWSEIDALEDQHAASIRQTADVHAATLAATTSLLGQQHEQELKTLGEGHERVLKALQSDLEVSTNKTASRDQEVKRLNASNIANTRRQSRIVAHYTSELDLANKELETQQQLYAVQSRISASLGDAVSDLTAKTVELKRENEKLRERQTKSEEILKSDIELARDAVTSSEKARNELKTKTLELEKDNKQLREKHSALEQSSKRDIQFAKNSASGSEQGRRRAIANMNKMFQLQPDDYKDEAFEQDIASPPDGKITDAIVERTMNRMNAFFDVANKFLEQHKELVARNNHLATGREDAKHIIPTLTAEVRTNNDTIRTLKNDKQALTNTVQALTNTVQALTNTVQALTNTVQALTNTVRARNNTIQALTNTVQARSNTIQALTNTVQARSNTIQALTNTVQARSNTIQALTKTVQALKDTIQKLNVDAQSKLNERETEIAKLKSMLDDLKKAAADVQRNYRQDTDNWKTVATNSAARLQSYDNAVSTQTESIALLRKFISDNADKFQ